jgi:hypothetical protein
LNGRRGKKVRERWRERNGEKYRIKTEGDKIDEREWKRNEQRRKGVGHGNKHVFFWNCCFMFKEKKGSEIKHMIYFKLCIIIFIKCDSSRAQYSVAKQ